jgi:hypothetical protein
METLFAPEAQVKKDRHNPEESEGKVKRKVKKDRHNPCNP